MNVMRIVHQRPAAVATAALTVAVLLLFSALADARPRPRRSSQFASNKEFGLGIMIGSPTALAGKLYLGRDTAIDFGVGVDRFRSREGLHVHLDFLWHPALLVRARPFWVPLYVGLGGRIFDFEEDDSGIEDTNIGVRAPVGIMLDFNNVPVDVFFELALILDLVGYDTPDVDLNGAVGIRYYF